MSKGSSRGFSLGRSRRSSFVTPKNIKTPIKSTYTTTPTPTTPTTTSSGFLSTMSDGFSFGVGSSVARNLVDRTFSSNSNSPKVESNHMCNDLEKSWKECMSMNNQDLNICKKAYEDYEACKKK